MSKTPDNVILRNTPEGIVGTMETSEEYLIPSSVLPDYESLTIRDDTAVENIFAEKQYRLLTEPLYSSWKPLSGGPFLALANVGLFYALNHPPVVPDVMLALDVQVKGDPFLKENNSYFVWKYGKSPEVAIELVSDRRGEEDTTKLLRYASFAVPYYVIFDPNKILSQDVLRSYILHATDYVPCPDNRFQKIGLGLTLWESLYEDHPATWWLRWCDLEGNLIPTGKERAEKLAARLRSLGVNPDTL